MLDEMKNITVVQPTVTIISRMHEADIPKLYALADTLLEE